MQSRDELHKLVDSIPEETIGTDRRALAHFQIWPTQLPAPVEELRQTYERRLKEVQESGAGMDCGVGNGDAAMEWPVDQPAAKLRSGYWSFDHLEGDTLVVETPCAKPL